jgi:hypothetical protein
MTTPFSPEQQAVLGAMGNVVELLFTHLSYVAYKAQLEAAALHRVLERRGLGDDEWERTLEEVRREEDALFRLDPEVQNDLRELRRLLGSEGTVPGEEEGRP